ncbi:MAG TPA: glycosyltransferase [Stellaceae bacterium]|nr:glycosyltransferase [Stellaceae bacterium]
MILEGIGLTTDGAAPNSIDRLRVIHIIGGLDPAFGGPSYSVPRLCEALAAVGTEATLLSVGNEDALRKTSGRGFFDYRFAWDYAHTPLLRGLRSSTDFSRALRNRAASANVIHNHGLWLMPNVEAGWIAVRSRRPLVVSPRGMLSPAALRFSRMKKQAFWRIFQGAPIRRAACIHATSEQEYQEIRSFGLHNPISIIPNGVDVPPVVERSGEAGNHRVVLALGRIHPKKGLDQLVRAWAEIEPVRPGWQLRIVGPSEAGHSDKLGTLAASLRLARVSIEGPVYGHAKETVFRDADLFVLPTMNENFGLTIGEALATGMPAISTKGAPWRKLEVERCGWWIDHGVAPLAAALANATAMPREELRVMGLRGRAWMARDFSWDRVARDMIDTYRWLTGTAEPPPSVRLT